MRAEDFGINIDKLSIATDDAGKVFQAAVARSGGLPLSSRDGELEELRQIVVACLLYTSPSPRDKRQSRMPSSA